MIIFLWFDRLLDWFVYHRVTSATFRMFASYFCSSHFKKRAYKRIIIWKKYESSSKKSTSLQLWFSVAMEFYRPHQRRTQEHGWISITIIWKRRKNQCQNESDFSNSQSSKRVEQHQLLDHGTIKQDIFMFFFTYTFFKHGNNGIDRIIRWRNDWTRSNIWTNATDINQSTWGKNSWTLFFVNLHECSLKFFLMFISSF